MSKKINNNQTNNLTRKRYLLSYMSDISKYTTFNFFKPETYQKIMNGPEI